jgi:hypothetical protein
VQCDQASPRDPKRTGAPPRQIEHRRPGGWTPVIDAHDHRSAIRLVHNAQSRPERERRMGGCEPVRVKHLAAGCATALCIPSRTAAADPLTSLQASRRDGLSSCRDSRYGLRLERRLKSFAGRPANGRNIAWPRWPRVGRLRLRRPIATSRRWMWFARFARRGLRRLARSRRPPS